MSAVTKQFSGILLRHAVSGLEKPVTRKLDPQEELIKDSITEICAALQRAKNTIFVTGNYPAYLEGQRKKYSTVRLVCLTGNKTFYLPTTLEYLLRKYKQIKLLKRIEKSQLQTQNGEMAGRSLFHIKIKNVAKTIKLEIISRRRKNENFFAGKPVENILVYLREGYIIPKSSIFQVVFFKGILLRRQPIKKEDNMRTPTNYGTPHSLGFIASQLIDRFKLEG